MTQIEFIEKMAAIQQENREANRYHSIQMANIEAKHRENVNEENDRYNNLKRREIAEWNEKKDELLCRETEIKKQRAYSRMEEESRKVES